MPKSTACANSILALMYNATAWANVADNTATSPLVNVYVSLHTGALTPGTGTQADQETNYENYLRVAKARTTAGWTAPSGGATENEGQIQFAQCGASTATLTYVATGTIATGGAGIAVLVLVKPIAEIIFRDLNCPTEVDYLTQKYETPIIYDGACLNFLMTSVGSPATRLTEGYMEFIWT